MFIRTSMMGEMKALLLTRLCRVRSCREGKLIELPGRSFPSTQGCVDYVQPEPAPCFCLYQGNDHDDGRQKKVVPNWVTG